MKLRNEVRKLLFSINAGQSQLVKEKAHPVNIAKEETKQSFHFEDKMLFMENQRNWNIFK